MIFLSIKYFYIVDCTGLLDLKFYRITNGINMQIAYRLFLFIIFTIIMYYRKLSSFIYGEKLTIDNSI